MIRESGSQFSKENGHNPLRLSRMASLLLHLSARGLKRGGHSRKRLAGQGKEGRTIGVVRRKEDAEEEKGVWLMLSIRRNRISQDDYAGKGCFIGF